MKRRPEGGPFDDVEDVDVFEGFIESIPTPIRCLTIHQPWASWIVARKKWIENRAWSTNHRGHLAIHASRKLMRTPEFASEDHNAMPLGAIVGTVEIVDCVSVDVVQDYMRLMQIPSGAHDRRRWHYETDSGGPICWLLANPKRLWKPIPCRGSQGLWTYKGGNTCKNQ